jgi:preprotein translocase subunit SecG
MPNFNDVLTIETDASGEGIRAMFSQQGKPVAFMSRAFRVVVVIVIVIVIVVVNTNNIINNDNNKD